MRILRVALRRRRCGALPERQDDLYASRKFLVTLIRHANRAAGAVLTHGIAVVEPTLLARLMAGTGGSLRPCAPDDAART
jgi:hypothetical protein